MTLRIIVRTDDAWMPVQIGGTVQTIIKTFDIEAPVVEGYLREVLGQSYTQRQVIGVEIIPLEPAPALAKLEQG